jgi:hypothetical protein
MMKSKRKKVSLPVKDQARVNAEKDRRRKVWRKVGLQLIAIFLVIVFLAGECATILPVE